MKRNKAAVACICTVAVAFLFAACGGDGPVVPVDDSPTMQLLTPNGGDAVAPGGTVEVTWNATDDMAVTSVDLSYIADAVTTPVAIATGLTGTSYTWTVPTDNIFGIKLIATARDSSGQTAADTSDAIFAIVAASARGYVTSAVCATCHADKGTALFNSGHPYKINQVVNGVAPSYPHSSVPTPPAGFSWNDITYVIGGYGWKARFMNDSGFIITDGVDGVNAQYNIERPDLAGGLPTEWVAYQGSQTTPKPYNCGKCHTTGWQDLTENGGVHQDGLLGIEGTWEEPGVGCEQCHEPGLDHVVSQSAADMTIDESAELCGSCHTRDPSQIPAASGGFIKHHEQYDEMEQAGHSVNTCGTCHEPHLGTRYGNAAAGGITTTCESCHTTVTTNNHVVPFGCETCHMARATKSARAINPFQGDVRTHIFAINANPFPRDSMFYVDQASGTTLTNGFVTLDMVCYQCHTDPLTGEGGGTASPKTLAELSARATGIHN